MGIPSSTAQIGTPPANDIANYVVTGALTGTGTSKIANIYGSFNLLIYGNSGPNGAWNATIRLERSFDGGTTWIVCGVGGGGGQAIYTTGTDISIVVSEPEKGVLYRLNCTAYTSGTLNYRFSTSGLAAMSQGVPPG